MKNVPSKKELLGGTFIAPEPHQNVEHLAVLVNRTPLILEPAPNLEKDLIQMPAVAGTRAERAQPLTKAGFPVE